ncbi:PASTA domain-containing protein [Paractinoplanes atraurantiacus]|uniref:PASTA domain-containing protein n=1 Tax=Paractinoplanes atraurantiacus TaxID=1036182 RepID=A0A285JSY5_9ACTN|nr:PASTA domain-containing protein [Actinoplanes atraurantiacus]SNY63193.1 PASTA domain-containing protein [Actinoplanes atraurantiacus]
MSDEKRPGEPAPEDAPGPEKPAVDDETKLDLPAVEETDAGTAKATASVPPPSDEDTLSGGTRADDTLDDVRTVPAIKDDKPTAVMPADDWAPSRANPAWSGRAEVRAPQPGRGYPEVDWAAADAEPRGRDRWWMPIVVGIIALLLLGVLGWAIYVIVQNDDSDDTPAPAATTSAAAPTRAATTTASATTETTTPSTAPTTTTTAPTTGTTDPTDTEVTVPALRGLALPAAQSALNATGLNYRIIYRVVDAPAGTVFDSDPAEGQEVPPDTVVTLLVAAQGTTTVPTTTATTGATQGADTDGQ